MLRIFFSRLAERLSSALIWSFVLILSVVRLTTVYHEYLAQFSEGMVIETATYVLLSLLALWFLNHSPVRSRVTSKPKVREPRRHGLVAEFADGFLSSL